MDRMSVSSLHTSIHSMYLWWEGYCSAELACPLLPSYDLCVGRAWSVCWGSNGVIPGLAMEVDSKLAHCAPPSIVVHNVPLGCPPP